MLNATLEGKPLLNAEMQQPVINTGGGDMSAYVKKTTTIAGVNLQDNITKSELQTALDFDTKLDKTDVTKQIYGTDGSGNQTTYTVSQSANASSIVQRASGGRIDVGTPTSDNNATNKLYVDGKVESLTGSSAPTTSTIGFIGQLYKDTTNEKIYLCENITEDTSTNPSTFTYTWTQLIRVTDVANNGVYGVVKLGDNASGFINNAYVGLMLREPTLGDIKQPRGGSATQQTVLLENIPLAVKYALCGSDRIGYYGDVKNTGSETNKKAIAMTPAEQALAKEVLGITTIKTTMDDTATVNTEYYLGSQNTLSITLPLTANAGDRITVDFTSGETATTLTITGTNVAGDTSFVPEANKLVEMSFKYDGTYWKLLVSSLDIPSGV